MHEKTKLCTKCGAIKPISAFSLCKNSCSGFYHTCKGCAKIYAAIYYRKNKNKIESQVNLYRKAHKDEEKKRVKKYYKNNRKKLKVYSKKYYHLNKEKALTYSKDYQKTNRKSINAQRKNARDNNPKERLNRSISEAFRASLKGEKEHTPWLTLVPYTFETLKKHLERQFRSGMTWKNYGSIWHLDHKIPLSVHNFSHPKHEDFKRAWALDNLQPLLIKDNLKKGAKLTKHFQPSLLLGRAI